MASDLTPAVKAAAEAMSRVATAAGFRLREQRHVLARAAVEAALPHLTAELAASTLTQSTPLAEYRARVKAEALREAADRWPMAWPIQGHEWLRARADQISRGGGNRD